MNKKTLGLYIILYTIIAIILYTSTTHAESFLEWGDSTGEVQGYRVYYSNISGSYNTTDFRETGTTKRISLDTVLKEIGYECNDTYYFVVRAYNQYGESGSSTEVTFSANEVELKDMHILRVM